MCLIVSGYEDHNKFPNCGLKSESRHLRQRASMTKKIFHKYWYEEKNFTA